MIKLLGRFRDPDGTEKFVYKNYDGIIEITWIKNKHNRDMDVFCLPTHYYCNLGCKFCHLTNTRQKQKMIPITVDELLECMKFTYSFIKKLKSKILFSFMGVGEPFLNSKLIVDFFKKTNYTLITTSYALSTMVTDIKVFDYFIEQINNYNIPLKIHFSLHSPIDSIRKELIPATNQPVEKILKELKNYEEKTKNNTIMMRKYLKHHSYRSNIEIHYTIINRINDSKKELFELVRLGKKYNIRLKILKFNPIKNFEESKLYILWIYSLSKFYGVSVVEYSPPGTKIGSSCGQFTKHYYLKCGLFEYIKFLIWKIKYRVKGE